ncbi:hypothetical protein AURDEDRAFT_79893 [Auricularia subglabra TFB-10046 SS5]|nr:hypothetical protein AURDEDRAFT_79893 [Auricularia subglabra TFB-10046 SS5]
MLARHVFRTATRQHVLRPPRSLQRRTFVRAALVPAADQLVELATALPWPPMWPPYASTIILIAILGRAAVLPISIWGKRKQFIVEDVVFPELKRNAVEVKQRAARDAKLALGDVSTPGSREEREQQAQKKFSEMMQARQRELFSALGCSPVKIMALPALSQLAVFLPMTFVFSLMSLPPTPLDSEAFLTFTTLTHPDMDYVTPVVLGLLGMATADASRWFISTERAHELQRRDQASLDRSRKTRLQFNFGKIATTAARQMAVARIVIGMLMPGSVMVYWLTSASFGLLQAWAFQWWARRRQPISLPVPPLRIGRKI